MKHEPTGISSNPHVNVRDVTLVVNRSDFTVNECQMRGHGPDEQPKNFVFSTTSMSSPWVRMFPNHTSFALIITQRQTSLRSNAHDVPQSEIVHKIVAIRILVDQDK